MKYNLKKVLVLNKYINITIEDCASLLNCKFVIYIYIYGSLPATFFLHKVKLPKALIY